MFAKLKHLSTIPLYYQTRYFHQTTNSSTRLPMQSSLSYSQAQWRSKLFAPSTHIIYNLWLKLLKGDAYEGTVSIDFTLGEALGEERTSSFSEKKNDQNRLFVDYAGKNISKLMVNSNEIKDPKSHREKRFLYVPWDMLKQGKNKIEVVFDNLYTKDGNGLHSFTDTDGKQYLYSNLEPYHANKIFPCFDQPDLKGIFNLKVNAPQDWVVISNEKLANNPNPNEDHNMKAWQFNPTPKLSTYLYAIIAGPYLEIKDDEPYRNIPMSVYCRESLYKYMIQDNNHQAKSIFEITKEGIKVYENLFGYKFPFQKYDQVFCPEFNIGAMENPGAVTFNDLYAFKEKVTKERETDRAITIVHELAHMWFGNLVTMKWWNDLWLNESFADYISYLCLTKMTLKYVNLANIWIMYFKRKGWAYREDQLKTTHPIAGEVKNTEQAEIIFDGITYAKGSATLKQLVCLIGETNFSKAMCDYFHTYQWSNATLDDFMACLQKYYHSEVPNAPKDLQQWREEWLTKAGLNECKPEWKGDGQIIIHQTNCSEEHPTLRFHKMKLALFNAHSQISSILDIILTNSSQTTLPLNLSNLSPHAMLLNYHDEAYIKVRIDTKSLIFFQNNLHKVPCELTRAMIWRSLWDMLRDAVQLTTVEFIEFISRCIMNEENDSILTNMLVYSNGAINALTPMKLRKLMNYKVFMEVYRKLVKIDVNDTNKIVLLKEELINFADCEETYEILLNWILGKDKELNKFELGLKNKWAIVRKIHKSKIIQNDIKHQIFNQVSSIDHSETQLYMRKECDALLLDNNEARWKFWNTYIIKEQNESVKMLGASMKGFNSNHHDLKDLKPFHDEFFDKIIEVFSNHDREYAKEFYNNLFPFGDDITEQLKRIDQLLQKIQVKQGDDWLKKMLNETSDDLNRKLKVYQLLSQQISATTN